MIETLMTLSPEELAYQSWKADKSEEWMLTFEEFQQMERELAEKVCNECGITKLCGDEPDTCPDCAGLIERQAAEDAYWTEFNNMAVISSTRNTGEEL